MSEHGCVVRPAGRLCRNGSTFIFFSLEGMGLWDRIEWGWAWRAELELLLLRLLAVAAGGPLTTGESQGGAC